MSGTETISVSIFSTATPVELDTPADAKASFVCVVGAADEATTTGSFKSKSEIPLIYDKNKI